MREKTINDIKDVKPLTTTNLADDIRSWLRAHPGTTHADFAKLAGISLRTLHSILLYQVGEAEPNWTRQTAQGIIRALGCVAYYTPEHKIR